MTKVLVTGSQGFLGSRIVHRLPERGDHLRVMDHARPVRSPWRKKTLRAL